jgi:hypothetical protein
VADEPADDVPAPQAGLAKTVRSSASADRPADRPGGQPPGKGRPTPTRREAEAARKVRLGALPSDPKARRRAEREARNTSFQRQRDAVRSGDTKNYPARDQGPARAFVRDYVDGRLRLLEFLMPLVVVAWLTLILRNTSLYIFASFAMELIVVVGITLGVVLNLRVKRAVREKFGAEHVRGTGFYAFSRAAMPRFLRQPRPVVTFTGHKK